MSEATALWLHRENAPEPVADGVVDYKFYCFNGEPKFLYASQGMDDRESAKMSFLEMDWSLAPFGRDDYKSFDAPPEKPATFDEMVEFAKVLSKGIPFVRADFYDHGGRPCSPR